MERKFYDVHYHLFDLSHPNLLAFLMHDDLISESSVKSILHKFPLLFRLLPLGIVGLFPRRTVMRVKDYLRNDAKYFRNLLSVMEGAIEYHFLYTEYFLAREKKYFGNFPGAKYNKIALCPLLIDFGYKNLNNQECFYNLPPAKPVMNQVVDLVTAIRFYYNYELIPHPDRQKRLQIVPTTLPKEKKLFEIYPFLGINTRNYDLKEIVDLFDKYFRGYEDDRSPEARQKRIYDKLGSLSIDLEDMIFRRRERIDDGYFSGLFAGIKLYPPMGFDPWPEEERSELDKVRFLYGECTRKRIPITVHCSDGGFVTSPEAVKFTDPSTRWQKVLERPEFKDLKINFAHIGTQYDGSTRWREFIFSKIPGNRNIYTDCSCQTPHENDYKKIKNLMNSGTQSNILFGSDFVINLIWSKSYNDYLYNFIQTTFLDERQKELMCEINPERFLFG